MGRRPILSKEKLTQLVNVNLKSARDPCCLVGGLQFLPTPQLQDDPHSPTHITFVPLLFQSYCGYGFQLSVYVGNWVECPNSFSVPPGMDFLGSTWVGRVDLMRCGRGGGRLRKLSVKQSHNMLKMIQSHHRMSSASSPHSLPVGWC